MSVGQKNESSVGKEGEIKMTSWQDVFQKMKKQPMQTVKAALCLLVINLLSMLPLVMGNVGLIILTALLIGVMCPFILYGVYETLFEEREQSTIRELMTHVMNQIKLKGWRMLLVNSVFFVLTAFISLTFAAIIVYMVGDALTQDLDVMSLFAGQLGQVLGVTYIALFLIGLLDYLIKYVQIGIYLGQEHVVWHAFKQWKQVLMITVCIHVIGFIPFVGPLAVVVISVMVPLKMILDLKAVEKR